MRRVLTAVVSLVTCFCVTASFAQEARSSGGEVATDAQRVTLAVADLMRQYNVSTGLWQTEGWWNAANTVTVLGGSVTRDSKVRGTETLANTFTKAQQKFPLFRNEYYDDEGWWALAWIQAYDVTHDKKFLQMAESIFQDMTTGWDDTCNGGIWWKKDRHYKNAIANELFLSVASHLANRTNAEAKAGYLNWARREWSWFDQSGMINNDSLVNDGLTPDCKNNGRNTWTYNQGVILGGLLELSKASREPGLKQKASLIASSAIEKLSDADHILHDRTEPNCTADTVQFKGIFMRNLGELAKVTANESYKQFLHANAESIWLKARADDGHIACRWSWPPKADGAGAVTSALDALVAAIMP